MNYRTSEERASQRKASRKLSTSSINLEESQMIESAKLRKKSSSLTQMSAQTNALMVKGSAEQVILLDVILMKILTLFYDKRRAIK